MVRKSMIQVALLITAVLISIAYFAGIYNQKYSVEQQNKFLQSYAQFTSQVNLLITQTNWDDTSSEKSFFEHLTLIPSVYAWRLSDQNNQLVNQYDRNASQDDLAFIEISFYLPNNHSSTSTKFDNSIMLNKTLLVRIGLVNSHYLPLAFGKEMMLWLAFSILVSVLFLYYKFLWVTKLESFARHVLVSDNQQDLKAEKGFQNIIGRAISQLLLNNTLLTQSKTELAEKIRRISYIDEVTELGNHLFFKAELEVRLHNHDEAESGLVMILSFADGTSIHQNEIAEDQQIEIAHLLKTYIAEQENAIVARLKQTEFGLILPNFTASQTDQFCRSLVELLAKSVFNTLEKNSHFVDIGVSSYKQGFGYYNIMAEADMALRNAQLQGANTWFVYGEPLAEHRSKGSLRWRTFLRKVLDKREVILFSQELHYFKEKNISHKEILSRVRDGRDIIAADTFLAMANQCGLSTEFDRQIIDLVLKHILYNKNNRPEDRYTINLFVSSLQNEQFTRWLIGKLSSYHELNRQIIFELPEYSLSHRIDEIAPVMRLLSSIGVLWSIEHFGAPDNDFSYLNKAQISMVKIDRRIINNIADSAQQQLLLSSILVNLRSRNIDVFAEGVEKKKDAKYLLSTDIDGAQGYHFDRPQKLFFDESQLKAV